MSLLACAGAKAEPTCLTPVAADGLEPLCNPFADGPVWSMSHQDSYASGASPYPGPRPGDAVTIQRADFPRELPTILTVSDPYPDGKRVLWFSASGVPDPKTVYKVDYDTMKVLGRFDSAAADGEQRAPVSSTSGVYAVLARGNRFVAVREQRLEVFTDAVPGVRTSGIKRIARFVLPPAALCRSDDRIVGIVLLYTGQIAFATADGMVGVVSLDHMDAAHLRTASINGARCAGGGDLEEVSNSISADEDGGIYVVSSRAMYRFDDAHGRLTRRWRAAYQNGASSGSTLSSGSGSTPDVTGPHRGGDRFVVITDGQKLMHLVLYWRDRIPRDWKPIAPGRDRRIACEFPVTFGDANATESASEQSVLTRGYASVVVNNVGGFDGAFSAIPAELPQAIKLVGSQVIAPQVPGNTPHGVQRIDWDPKTRTCHSVWADPDVSIPNAVPTMSAATGMMYATALQNGIWGLQVLDWATGRPRMFVPAGPGQENNSFYSATTVGPDGSILQGTIQQLEKFRTATPLPPPRLACRDVTPPVIRLLARKGPLLRGRARDLACGRPGRLRHVEVSLARVVRGGCRFAGPGGHLGRTRSCRGTRFVRVRLRRGVFARRVPSCGRYRAAIRATDAVGQTSLKRRRLVC